MQQIKKRLQIVILLTGIVTAAFTFYDKNEKQEPIKALISNELDTSTLLKEKQKKEITSGNTPVRHY